MVAPGNRRPGHSRRAQYGTFLGYVVAAVGLGVGVALLVASANDAEAFSGLRSEAADFVAPASNVGARGRGSGQGILDAISGYLTSGARVARLEREVAEARVKLTEAAALKEENARLKALLGLADSDPKPVAYARLIGSSAASSRRFATLGAGSRQGVREGMPVRSPLGLIGRVLEVGERSARVLLITDGQSTVPVRRARDGIQAYAIGQGNGTVRIKLTNTGLNPLRRGDAMVTSGSGGLFRPGEVVAVVETLTHDGAIARPLSDPALTDYVMVEPFWVDPAQSAAPPPATPAGQN